MESNIFWENNVDLPEDLPRSFRPSLIDQVSGHSVLSLVCDSMLMKVSHLSYLVYF